MLRSLVVVALVSCVAVAAADAAVSIDPYAEQKRDSRRSANDTVELRVKRLVDRYRAAVGLSAGTLDAKLSKGRMAHAPYMRRKKDSDPVPRPKAPHPRPNPRGAPRGHPPRAQAPHPLSSSP